MRSGPSGIAARLAAAIAGMARSHGRIEASQRRLARSRARFDRAADDLSDEAMAAALRRSQARFEQGEIEREVRLTCLQPGFDDAAGRDGGE